MFQGQDGAGQQVAVHKMSHVCSPVGLTRRVFCVGVASDQSAGLVFGTAFADQVSSR